MFEHYLPNKNERATVAPKSKFLQLNQGLVGRSVERVTVGLQCHCWQARGSRKLLCTAPHDMHHDPRDQAWPARCKWDGPWLPRLRRAQAPKAGTYRNIKATSRQSMWHRSRTQRSLLFQCSIIYLSLSFVSAFSQWTRHLPWIGLYYQWDTTLLSKKK